MTARLLFILLFLFSTILFASAKVYQYVDEEGNVVFSDKPVEGAIERKVREPAVIKFETKKVEQPPEEKTLDEQQVVEEEKAKPYTKFKISSPVNDGTIKQDLGIVEIVLEIKPALQTKHKHKVKYALDGVWDKKLYSTNSISLSNIDRGVHRVKAAIVDDSGKRLKTTKEVVFHLKRFSKHFR